MDNAPIREELARCGQLLATAGLVWGHSGNISARVDAGSFLISGGGTDLGYLGTDGLVLCHTDQDRHEGAGRPSMEVDLHRLIYRECGEAQAVIHSQPFFTTVVACSSIEVRTDFLPEAMSYLATVARVPYHHAGSRALAEATASTAPTSRALLLDNHGAVCWGSSLHEALLLTQTLEFLCRLLVTSHTGNIPFNYLGEDVMQDFHRHLRSIGRLP